MSADKYPSIFSRQMKAIVYLFFVSPSENVRFWRGAFDFSNGACSLSRQATTVEISLIEKQE